MSKKNSELLWRYSPTLGATLLGGQRNFAQEIELARERVASAQDPVEVFRAQRQLERWERLAKQEALARQSGKIDSGLFAPLVVFLFGVAMILSISAGSAARRRHAESYARTYASHILGWTRPTVLCASEDTDNNQYVNCTVAQDGSRRLLECPANTFVEFNKACREVRARTWQETP